MGARATIRIIHPTSDTPIHFYSHWGGDDIVHSLCEGIKNAEAGGRLTDYQYATRIIFDTLTGLDGGTTGFGICIGDEGQPCDVEFDTPTISWATPDERPVVMYRGAVKNASDFAYEWTRLGISG